MKKLFLLLILTSSFYAYADDCGKGYAKSPLSNKCMQIPDNSSFALNGNWICDSGYVRKGNKCLRDSIPENAFSYGTSWKCYSGFTKIGNSCKKMSAEEKRLAEEKRIAEENRIIEKKRIAEEKRQAEIEAERIAEEKKRKEA